jgi:hypothetical protein
MDAIEQRGFGDRSGIEDVAADLVGETRIKPCKLLRSLVAAGEYLLELCVRRAAMAGGETSRVSRMGQSMPWRSPLR